MKALACVLGEGQALLLDSRRQISTDEGRQKGRGVEAAALNVVKDHVSRLPRLLKAPSAGQLLPLDHPQFTQPFPGNCTDIWAVSCFVVGTGGWPMCKTIVR